MSFITVPEVLTVVFLTLLCFAYIFLKEDFQVAVSKYISWIIIIIPVGCYLGTRLTFLPKGLQDFSENFLPESIGILFTFFIIETFHKSSKQKAADQKALITLLINYRNLLDHIKIFVFAHLILFSRTEKEKDDGSPFSLTYHSQDLETRLEYVATASINNFKGYYLPPKDLEYHLLSKPAQDAIETSYNEIIKIIQQIASQMDHNLHIKISTPLNAVLSKHSEKLLDKVNNFKSILEANPEEKIVDRFLHTDFSQIKIVTDYSSPFINMAERNQSACKNLLIALKEIDKFKSKKSPAV